MSGARLQRITRQLRRELAQELPHAVRLMAPALPKAFALLGELLEELEDQADRLELLEAENRSRFPDSTVTRPCLDASIER